jgi:hypothetical protein
VRRQPSPQRSVRRRAWLAALSSAGPRGVSRASERDALEIRDRLASRSTAVLTARDKVGRSDAEAHDPVVG